MNEPRKPLLPVNSKDVVQFVIHGALAPRLIEWLNKSGFNVDDWSVAPDDLRTFMVVPTEALLNLTPVPREHSGNDHP